MGDSASLRARADALRALHVPGTPLLLVNAWDAATARIVARAGAPAIASTSAGNAYALGYADGQLVSRSEMLTAVATIAAAVDLPVTADVEAGYGEEPEDAAATARGVLSAGAVGLNLEDTTAVGSGPLLPLDRYLDKIAAVCAVAAEAGIPLVLNARTDVFLGQVGDPAGRVDHAIERGRAFLAAGADCVFVPSVTEPHQIAALVAGIGGPVNVLWVPGSPTLAELATLGVARVSVGSGPYRAMLALTKRIAAAAYRDGDLTEMARAQIAYPDAQQLMAD
jgi:2-methylisocitrate lyase-like PEP mutase family enzyme